jgi:hypothetical protein
MKTAEWKRVARSLLPADEPWEFRGSLCYRLPVHRVLFGVLGEGSGFDTGVYVWRVLMPLFVPAESVVLSWSERIGGGARKYDKLNEDTLVAAITTAVKELPGDDEEALGQLVAQGSQAGPNRRLHEVAAYAQLLLGDLTAAQEALALAETGVARTPWEQEIIKRTRLIGRFLGEGGRDRAVEQLDSWCKQTVGTLGLRRSVASDRQT